MINKSGLNRNWARTEVFIQNHTKLRVPQALDKAEEASHMKSDHCYQYML